MKPAKRSSAHGPARARSAAFDWIARAQDLLATGDLPAAARAFRTAADLNPDRPAAYAGLAIVAMKQGRLDDALAHCMQAVALGRDTPDAGVFITAGRVLHDLGRNEEAVAALSSAIALKPDSAEAYVTLGLAFEGQDKALDAFAAYQKAIGLNPRDVRAYNNLAAVLIGLRQFALAISTARVAVALAPNHPDVYLNLATALRLNGDDDEALATYKAIVALKPDHGEALVELCHRKQHACDWDGLAALQASAWTHSYRQGWLVSPFSVMTSSDEPLEQLRCARVWGQHHARLAGAPLAPYQPRPLHRRGERIRLGYLSADFHNHATAMLIVDMLEQHDRSGFELFGYSLGPDDGSPMRRRLVSAFDRFVDLAGTPDTDAAIRIRDDEIDILLDLKGYTQNARVKILAQRPAPIQINYLGFPGTMGAPFIDYIVADRHVAPHDHQAFFDEKIIQLPDCYQPNDRKRATASGLAKRADYGLPDHGFVFCSFNAPYKITPDIFDIWMRLLAAVPGSVLWLLDSTGRAADNLRREAGSRGIGPERLVFAPFVTAEQHLLRLAVADLFLDTFPVNAHTTASEALWVGLPIITCIGNSFASRVAGSLLHAIGAADLVTTSLETYEAEAVRLALCPASLQALRHRLMANRQTSPLFDTPRYTRHFEAAMSQAVAYRDDALPPRPFTVPVQG